MEYSDAWNKMIEYPYKVQRTKLKNESQIAYIDEGQGNKTILFIHGLAMYSMCWARNIEYLKARYRCIAVDLPGNGLSTKGDYPYSIDYFAESIFELIENLKLTNLCLVGHSMGGQVAMRLLINHPTCAEKLVLCAPAGFETFNHFQRSMYKSTVHLLDFFSTEENSLRQVVRSSFFHYPEQVDQMTDQLVTIMKTQRTSDYRRMIERCIEGMMEEPVYHELGKIMQPVLVIFGDRDALIPNRLVHPVATKHVAEAGVKKLPNARLQMLPKCGHFLQIEKAGEVNELLQEFLETK